MTVFLDSARKDRVTVATGAMRAEILACARIWQSRPYEAIASLPVDETGFAARGPSVGGGIVCHSHA